jgi:hypothetical protein
LRPAWANTSQDPISKITRAKWTRGVAEAIENLSSNPSCTTDTKKITIGLAYNIILYNIMVTYQYMFSLHPVAQNSLNLCNLLVNRGENDRYILYFSIWP